MSVSILVWQALRSTFNKASGCIAGSLNLFYYKNVKPIDVVLARIFLEIVIYLLTFCIIYPIAILYLDFPFDQILARVDYIVIGLFLLVLFSTGVSLLLAILGRFFPSTAKISGLILRILYFTSGILYPLTNLPLSIREILKYNPVTQIVEIFRYGFFSQFTNDYIMLEYIILISLSVLCLGLWFIQRYRFKLIKID